MHCGKSKISFSLIILFILNTSFLIAAETPLTNDDVIKLSKLGFAEEVIISKIMQAKDVAFNLDTDSLIKLKEQGVSQKVISVMLNRSKSMETGKEIKSGSEQFDAALTALKKMENLVETGVSDTDYNKSLPGLTLLIKQYKESTGAKEALVIQMENVLQHYLTASKVWQRFFKAGTTSISGHEGRLSLFCKKKGKAKCETILNEYPDVPRWEHLDMHGNRYKGDPYVLEVDPTLSVIWKKASQELGKLIQMKDKKQ